MKENHLQGPKGKKHSEFPKGEPVAIVGMACRFPGASSIAALWQLLESGGNTISEIVPGMGNWRVDEIFSGNSELGQACRFCSYVDEIEMFDAGFFRISPVEANLLDPQQRMMLETSWQALEDAGIDPDQLKGSRTGVYTGISNDEYRMLVVDSNKPADAASCLYALSGTNLNGTSGRVSFVLGLMGPAKAVDAACASSLVSVHDAVSDLQQGKADLAIAGGVQAILNGRIFELRADAMMLSVDGQCKAFDESANGYVRGEGCGVVVLKRLSEAERDGNRIWGVIRGSAVNHGGASSGLTVPHEPALEQVMQTALSQAGIEASEVDYLEAHGTGTLVGDPIEINAVASVYCKGRDPERPLLVGSVKTNLGHLESAAGIAGLMKATLVMQRGIIPKHLHFNNPNPSLDWKRLPLKVTSSLMELPPKDGRPCIAGVNSFGISGTNAHIIVEEYQKSDNEPYPRTMAAGSKKTVTVNLPAAIKDHKVPNEGLRLRNTRLLPLSGKSKNALSDLAGRYLSWLDGHNADSISMEPLLSDMAWSASIGRSHFDHREAILFNDTQSLREQLRALAEGDGNSLGQFPSKIAFVYTGQGSQWAGMGKTLYETEPVMRSVLDRCEKTFLEYRGESLLEVMFGKKDGKRKLEDTAWEQPALYALECGLTALWASLGVRPDVVLGHSIGELAAAHTAGVYTLEEGMRFAAARGLLMSQTEAGAMIAVFATFERVTSIVNKANAVSAGLDLSVSADNGSHRVVSGTIEDIEQITNMFAAEKIRTQRLNTKKAFHSALLEPILDDIERAIDDIAIANPSLDLISNLTGQLVEEGTLLDGFYWRRHAREAVAFSKGIGSAADLGVDVIIEVGPRPILGNMAVAAWPESAKAPVVISSLFPPAKDSLLPSGDEAFLSGVAKAYQSGLSVQFEGLYAGEERRLISIPDYPFQRDRYWLEGSKGRRHREGHPMLGERRKSASGEITHEIEMFSADPDWMSDHRVFGRVIAPGALYGAMAVSAQLAEGRETAVVDDMQLHNAMVFPRDDTSNDPLEEGRRVQLVIDAKNEAETRQARIFSKGNEENWVLHVEYNLTSGTPVVESGQPINLESLKNELSSVDVAAYYQARIATGIELGPSFQTLGRVWSRPGEALGEIYLPNQSGTQGLELHPLMLDGCFQVVAAARNPGGAEGKITYLPFGWERLWLTRRMPGKVFCHVMMNETTRESENDLPPEVITCQLRIYDESGNEIGGIDGYTVKRATPGALFSADEGVDDLLYEIVWREVPLSQGITPADFLPAPNEIAENSGLLSEYLAEEGVSRDERSNLLGDLELWSRSRALMTLDRLGWVREVGKKIIPEELREHLGIKEEHQRLFRRILEMLAKSGILEEKEDEFVVRTGPDDKLPGKLPVDVDGFVTKMEERYPHGVNEIGLFKRCGGALHEVLRGEADPLTLLFSSGDPTPGDLYLKAPIAKAANRIMKETVRTLVADLPEGKRLRIIEVGAGTGSATAAILPELPEGRFDYMYTDISAGFFSEAEARFGDGNGAIKYAPLNIEKDPIGQGFEANSYDLLIASNVLHATMYLEETLEYCLKLLAPSGQLVALENLTGQGWMDLTFGQLDGWWRFADQYRPHHALAEPKVWHRVLKDVGFAEAEVIGVDESDPDEFLDKGVIIAQGPAEIKEEPGIWVLVSDDNGIADQLARDLSARNQSIVLAGDNGSNDLKQEEFDQKIIPAVVDFENRESWCSMIKGLPEDIPLRGVIHPLALVEQDEEATVEEIKREAKRIGASALAMVQGLTDADAKLENGVWFLTRGAQVLEREHGGNLLGSILWGFGKAVSLEAVDLQPRMIDLDPASQAPLPDLVKEFLYPDQENHIAYRSGQRQVARLVRGEAGMERLSLPDEPDWVLAPDPSGIFEKPCIKPLLRRTLEPREVRISVEATGLNFWDVFRSLGFIEEGDLGREMCGHVIEVGSEVSTIAVGDHVTGLGFGAFAFEMITREELVALAPEGFTVSELATIPSAYVSAALSYELSGLNSGDRVLIHAGAGGVGLAAIQMAQAAGAEVFATASAPKQDYLRSVGVKHIFDSRQTTFGKEILEATDGQGVDVVLNSLTGEGYIDTSLSCLAQGGRFIELARKDILSEDEMAAVRPDVNYAILELDVLKKTDPDWVGRVLGDVMSQLASGKLKPIIHSRWPLAEAGAALRFMRSARHIGKIVLTAPPLVSGNLREDRTYLVTGGLGGIGCEVADWLGEKGAGTIVLNGRRPPGEGVQVLIDSLRQKGFNVVVELADVSDEAQLGKMLERIGNELPPLGGIVHSVGVLSDGALTNQNWDRFETVLWPKILGAWHLHRATRDIDLEFFILFSSRVGVMGNPGQSNHAAANAYLDQLARHRRALGLPGQAIAWGAWSEIGEAAEQFDRIERQRAARGGRWFTPQQGMNAFDRLVREDKTNSVVMAMDWSVFEDVIEQQPTFLEDLLSSSTESEVSSPSLSKDIISRIRETPVAERENLLVSFLQEELQAVLRLPSIPEPTVGFFDLGMDSLMAVELRNRLNRAFGDAYSVSNTLVFDYPDITVLARHLVEELGEIPEAEPESLPAPQTLVVPSGDQIAIVGMACRFPGSPDINTFWNNLEEGFNAVTDGRQDDASWSGILGDPKASESIYRKGGFINGLDQFDADFFGILPIEARTMDPRQRLLLETSWQALEDAGVAPNLLKGSRTGVYVGLGVSEYRDVVSASGNEGSFLGTAPSVAIGRVAYTLGLMGPAIPVDMTCSSSLVAIHQAAASLRDGEVNLALAGGVQAVLSPRITTFMAEYGMLSKNGLCKTFDSEADGFVRGEGCGMVVLKRLRDAETDGDRIWGLIKGTAVNQNGAGAGLTVPNGKAQEQVINEAISHAGILPSEVDYLEVHATGSQLGDPIEVQAVAKTYGQDRSKDCPLFLGTVKTNIGHLESAAGIAGLIKVLLAMNHGIIPKHLHFNNPSQNIFWNDLPVEVTSEQREWPGSSDRPPLAGVSAFAISGTNAHIVVEGMTPQTPTTINGENHSPKGVSCPIEITLPESVPLPDFEKKITRTPRILPLSGKTTKALRELAERYLSWLDGCTALDGEVVDSTLADMAWTAGMGRDHFNHRKGILFEDTVSLREKLKALHLDENDINPPVGTKVAFCFTGEIANWAGMGKELYETQPVVRAVLDYHDGLLAREMDASLLKVMFGQSKGLEKPAWVQPAAFALESALSALWSSLGIRPNVVFGMGSGEVSAAHAAGILSLEDGLKLAQMRGSLAGATGEDDDGKMLGRENWENAVENIIMGSPSLPMISGVTGKALLPDEKLDASFWNPQIGRQKNSNRIFRTLSEMGVIAIVEIGPDSILGASLPMDWPTTSNDDVPPPTLILASSSRTSVDGEAFLRSVAELYEAGVTPDFRGLFAGEERCRISLPGYPFQRKRFWFDMD
ncbi:MAG: SDR family NAD(P)-dependent oxidoreductase [Rhodobacteraceae bacterium]|nr:SDR family NAD(P)-dependent oxidoreductase [Paracoccaceae bacterium]